MIVRIRFCSSNSHLQLASDLARLIEDTGWDLTVGLDGNDTGGEFAIYLDDKRIFSLLERGKLPEPLEIIPAIRTRLFSGPHLDGGGCYGLV